MLIHFLRVAAENDPLSRVIPEAKGAGFGSNPLEVSLGMPPYERVGDLKDSVKNQFLRRL